jgi:adenosylcobinamide kinase/adenosylcobinamide-phosphate guanylyltransferase
VPHPADSEWAARIALHQARRPAKWTTLETTELPAVLRAARDPVLIDCLSTWLTRLIDEIDAWQDRDRAAAHVQKQTARLLDALGSARVDVVLVSNEVGWSVVPGTASGRLFRDEMGRLNAAVSGASDHVALTVAGRVLDISCWPVVAD